MWFCVAATLFFSSVPSLVSSAPVAANGSASIYDAIVVGGGPSGLSATSGLARVRRKVLMIDSGEYRNGPTRHMHDVIGFDGVTPLYYRYQARGLIAQYENVTMVNGTVTRIQGAEDGGSFRVTCQSPNGTEVVWEARKIVLGTGLRDDLPATPGLRQNWGQGIYWCPWCDGHEHADQSLGILGPLDKMAGSAREIVTLNSDVIAFVNGTDTLDFRAKASASYSQWAEYLKLRNVTVENRTIVAIERLANGSVSHDGVGIATAPEHDNFRVVFADNTSVTRNAFLTSFPEEQASSLGADLGVYLYKGRLAANSSVGLMTNVAGVYAIGDANSDNVTNVPHAIFSGKRTAVYLHGERIDHVPWEMGLGLSPPLTSGH